MVHACRLHSLESCPAPGHAPVSSPSRVAEPGPGEVEQVRLRVCRPKQCSDTYYSYKNDEEQLSKAKTKILEILLTVVCTGSTGGGAL